MGEHQLQLVAFTVVSGVATRYNMIVVAALLRCHGNVHRSAGGRHTGALASIPFSVGLGRSVSLSPLVGPWGPCTVLRGTRQFGVPERLLSVQLWFRICFVHHEGCYNLSSVVILNNGKVRNCFFKFTCYKKFILYWLHKCIRTLGLCKSSVSYSRMF